MMLAEGGIGILILLALVWAIGIANAAGITSIIVSFTKYRHSRFAFACALTAVVLGVSLTINFGRPTGQWGWIVYAGSWIPAPLGLVGFLRWRKKKNGVA